MGISRESGALPVENAPAPGGLASASGHASLLSLSHEDIQPMKNKNFPGNPTHWQPARPKKMGNPVSKMTLVAGRRIGGALRAEQARQQKRRDTRH